MQIAERIDAVPTRHTEASRGTPLTVRADTDERLYNGEKFAHTVEMVVDPAEFLRERGYKVTAQRLAVLRAVSGRSHLTAEDVVDVVRADIGTISHRAVYDAVGVLADIGLLRRIQPSGSAARYEDRVGDNHHHLICRQCGRMVDVDCAVGATPCLTAVDDAGYEIDEAEVIYWGRCPACRQAAEGA
jgi:Fur family transcriptional regulator, stress-responsive regulator